MDRNILRVLSLYDESDLFQLWYELGEDDATDEVLTREEILSRLESLKSRGFVERIREGDIWWPLTLKGEVER